MNEILVLERLGDPDDGMFSCRTGTIDGNGQKNIGVFAEEERAKNRIDAYLRKTGKSIRDYESIEEALVSFLDFCRSGGDITPPIETGKFHATHHWQIHTDENQAVVWNCRNCGLGQDEFNLRPQPCSRLWRWLTLIRRFCDAIGRKYYAVIQALKA